MAEHVLTISVRDSAAMLDATCGPDVGATCFAPPPERPFLDEVSADPGTLRIAYTTRSLLGNKVDRECVEGVEATAALLRELGHEVVEAAPPLDRRPFTQSYLTVIAGETAADIADWSDMLGRKVKSGEIELTTSALQLIGRSTSARDFGRANRYLQRASRKVHGFFVDHDVLLTPTVAQPPPPTGSTKLSGLEAVGLRSLRTLRAGGILRMPAVLDTFAAKTFEFLAFTPVFNVTGQPAVSIPLYWSESGLPIGMHFVARYADEATLFRLAAQLEKARPWVDRKPPVCAD